MKKYEDSKDLIFFIEYFHQFGCCRHDFDKETGHTGYGRTKQEAYEDLIENEAK